MNSNRYQRQDRGTSAAYESYFRGMDKSVQQKIALTTAHFPTSGKLADMGCGSGRGTYDLACLYQDLEIVGVDVNPASVERAGELYNRPNAKFVVGDISDMVFPAGSLDGILDSSVLHHVTSFNDYDLKRVFCTLDNQVAQLKTGGVIIIRDFVIPGGPAEVYLDLPADDGADSGQIKELSTAALFQLFARHFRSGVNPAGPVPFEVVGARDGRIRHQLKLRAAAEFVLRKDYRADWDTELIEEYTYMRQGEFEAEFRRRGLRIVASMPIWNPWIVKNRFDGRFDIRDLTGQALPFPPTNYLIVGEKVSAGSGVVLIEAKNDELATPRFLELKHYLDRSTGSIYELAERPNFTIDLVPWFIRDGRVFVLAKKDFPRPIVNSVTGQPNLDGSCLSGYITEPISAIVGEESQTPDVINDILVERAGLRAAEIIEVGREFKYFTSPGGVDEIVRSRLVEITPVSRPHVEVRNYTGFSAAGFVRELDATQTLRAAQVGGMFDARLEINIYRLLLARGLSPGPWIGAPIKLQSQQTPGFAVASGSATLKPERRTAFEALAGDRAPQFLSVREGAFQELDSDGAPTAEVRFEYVLPKRLSKNTAVVVPVAKASDGIYVALEHRDLPAVQRFTGNSSIVTAPAWRLPAQVKHRSEIPAFLTEALSRDFAIKIGECSELGGPYFPTPGITPELVRPYAVEFNLSEAVASPLKVVRLDEVLTSIGLISDAHLLIGLFRLSHALDALRDLGSTTA